MLELGGGEENLHKLWKVMLALLLKYVVEDIKARVFFILSHNDI